MKVRNPSFLPSIVSRSKVEKIRQEHFGAPGQYDSYYDAVAGNPDLWCPDSVEFRDWKQLEALGLMAAGDWR